MLKKYFQRTLTLLLATFILVIGRGYGSLTHTCEQHGEHLHLMVNTQSQACEHEEHEHSHQTEEGYAQNEHDTADVQFVFIHAETIAKNQPEFLAPYMGFATPQYTFLILALRTTLTSVVSHFEPPSSPRPSGRQLLAWVQSFLI
ncbi:hypothetical protein P1X15_21775 [Runella sp. MFBS21]|uniref:hypothetical protein n=1 Tax=Runella sp. MFBS21 TaxID=3034018 RepID=UPI0023F895CB|nr:hypothetical protein [Runella sp. MFBS21]MDF7820265.1 hypothetical protein [Runella sp. MFBS21]